MSAEILRGGHLAERLLAGAARRAAAFRRAARRPPRLAALALGPAQDAEAYLRKKAEGCRKAGVDFEACVLPASAGQARAEKAMRDLSAREEVDAVVLELPLPKGLDPEPLLEALDPAKDAEGLTPFQRGRLYGAKTIREARGAVWPCTAEAIVLLLEETGFRAAGREAVVVGRSSVVGRPTAHLLSCLDATVTLCHSRTRDLGSHVARAQILVLATPRPLWLKEPRAGSVVLDAGTHVLGGRMVGDADPRAVKRAGWLTPVPGGVGPVTSAVLVAHAVEAAQRRRAA